MSAYNARRAPNVSQYIQNLNTMPSAHDMALSPTQEGFAPVNEDLTLFATTDFFDFDMGEMTNISQPLPEYNSAGEAQRVRRQNVAAAYANNGQSTDFLNEDFQFTDFSSFPALPNTTTNDSLPNTTNNGLPGINTAVPAPQPSPYTLPQFTASPATSLPTGAGQKRKASASAATDAAALEAQARKDAEDDKRRRNTAASARFRVKKKERERALEKTAREMTDKVAVLEARVQQLEMENKWLKGLITGKEEGGSGKEGGREMEEEGGEERSCEERNEGVGTTEGGREHGTVV